MPVPEVRGGLDASFRVRPRRVEWTGPMLAWMARARMGIPPAAANASFDLAEAGVSRVW